MYIIYIYKYYISCITITSILIYIYILYTNICTYCIVVLFFKNRFRLLIAWGCHVFKPSLSTKLGRVDFITEVRELYEELCEKRYIRTAGNSCCFTIDVPLDVSMLNVAGDQNQRRWKSRLDLDEILFPLCLFYS